MKKLLILLFSFFLLSSPSVFADDISDFQIEGMSIGDSLLDYFSEDEIINNIYDAYPNKEIRDRVFPVKIGKFSVNYHTFD